ncbi:MAG: FmdB family zinc ribbon protein [Chloroflexota bacterium]
MSKNMPLYVYACQTCELELEEMHALGQAPEKSIRCPLCGGYFERVVSLFQVRKRTDGQTDQNSTTHSQTDQNGTMPPTHGVDCVCCFPTRYRR